jgi:hypothetical protein
MTAVTRRIAKLENQAGISDRQAPTSAERIGEGRHLQAEQVNTNWATLRRRSTT